MKNRTTLQNTNTPDWSRSCHFDIFMSMINLFFFPLHCSAVKSVAPGQKTGRGHKRMALQILAKGRDAAMACLLKRT
jgi:hypothetical protein